MDFIQLYSGPHCRRGHGDKDGMTSLRSSEAAAQKPRLPQIRGGRRGTNSVWTTPVLIR